jgi:predicted ATPase
MKLQTLGGLELLGARFTQPKPLLLLVYLALEGPQPRAHLAELFWPRGERRKSLSMALTRLHASAGAVIEGDAHRVWTTVESDVKGLLGALDRRDWRGAGDLYAGAFLAGVAQGDPSSELEEWVYTTREYLAERVQHALLNLAEEAVRKGDFRAAAAFAERAYKLPGSGGSDVVTLGRLYPLLCAGDSLLAPDVRKEAEEYGITLRLTSEEARAKFKPRAATTLPMRGTSFVGRDVELTELATLLSQPKVSLLTLLGPAGVGKTRLALQLAHDQLSLGAFAGGVYFIPLDALSDADLIPLNLIHHLGLRQDAESEPLEQLTDFIAERSILLVLDNFEHLGEGSTFLPRLLRGCPNLKLLVTTREKLRLEEEYVFPVEGLPYPRTPSEEGRLADAVQLFRERAQQVAPHFNLEADLPDVLEVCRLVEGLPLGIELAAGWVRLLSCAEIVGEIRGNLEFLESATHNVPERHRSLKAAFEASWRLLNPREQGVLGKLSVFRGGFRRDAAAEVAGATIPRLASLVDKSLLRVLPNGRYDRHPLLYGFTQEKLTERPDEQKRAQAKHVAFYLSLAEEAEPQLQGKEQVSWFGRLSEELDNFREAFRCLDATGDAETALRLGAALGYFWNTQGHYTEGYSYLTRFLSETSGRSLTDNLTEAKALFLAGDLAQVLGDHNAAQALLERSLAVLGGFGAESLRAKSLRILGVIAHTNRGDPARARALYTSALALARQSGDGTTVATVLRTLGNLNVDQANYHEARVCYEESAALSEQAGDEHGRAKALSSLATVLTSLGEFDRAHALNKQSLALLRAVGDTYGEGIALLNLGMDASQRGDIEGELQHYRASLDLFRKLGHKHMVSHLLNNLGGMLQKRGDAREAYELLEESLTIQRAVGNKFLKAHALNLLGRVLEDQGKQEEAYRCYGECLRLCRETNDNWSLMRVLEALARWHLNRKDHAGAQTLLTEAVTLAHASGDQKTLVKALETQAKLGIGAGDGARATHLLAHAEKLRQTLDFTRMPRYQRDYEEMLARVREELGKKRFKEAWAHGQTLELEEAVRLCRAFTKTPTPRASLKDTITP